MSRVAVFDVETTTDKNQRIVEISAVILDGHLPEDAIFQTLVNPGVPIGYHGSIIHGITMSDLHGQPVPEDVYPRLLNFIRGISTVTTACATIKAEQKQEAEAGKGIKAKEKEEPEAKASGSLRVEVGYA